MQTRLGSLIEAWVNILVGFGVNWTANMLIFPLFGFNITAGQAFHVGLIFTGISLLRSYALRRIFNRIRRFHHAPHGR